MKTLLLSLMLGAALAPAAAQETVSHGRFKDVRLYRPKGEVKTVALLFSGANGWGAAGPGAAAQVLLDTGAVVAAIDTPSLLANFNQDGGSCVVPEGDVENLSRFLQGYARLPAYFPPLAVGVGSRRCVFTPPSALRAATSPPLRGREDFTYSTGIIQIAILANSTSAATTISSARRRSPLRCTRTAPPSSAIPPSIAIESSVSPMAPALRAHAAGVKPALPVVKGRGFA